MSSSYRYQVQGAALMTGLPRLLILAERCLMKLHLGNSEHRLWNSSEGFLRSAKLNISFWKRHETLHGEWHDPICLPSKNYRQLGCRVGVRGRWRLCDPTHTMRDRSGQAPPIVTAGKRLHTQPICICVARGLFPTSAPSF